MPRLRLAKLRQAVHMLWNDQKVDRCLGIDVSEGQTGVVLIDDSGGDLLGYDLVKYGWTPLACCPAQPCAQYGMALHACTLIVKSPLIIDANRSCRILWQYPEAAASLAAVSSDMALACRWTPVILAATPQVLQYGLGKPETSALLLSTALDVALSILGARCGAQKVPVHGDLKPPQAQGMLAG